MFIHVTYKRKLLPLNVPSLNIFHKQFFCQLENKYIGQHSVVLGVIYVTYIGLPR